MRLSGWLFMVGSLGFVLVLTAFCFYKVLARPSATEHMHAPLDIDTHDLDT
jgi:hypothetical protein